MSFAHDLADRVTTLGRITTKSETIAKASGSGTDTYNWVYTYDTLGRLRTLVADGRLKRSTAPWRASRPTTAMAPWRHSGGVHMQRAVPVRALRELRLVSLFEEHRRLAR